MRKFRSLALIVGLLFVASGARADIPGLDHLWTVAGAMQTGAGIGTYIACTNAGTASNTIGVEMLGPTGAAVGTAQSISVAPDSTVIFGSSNAASISVDASLGTLSFTKGQARIYATSKSGIICSAFLAEQLNAVPTSMVSLTVAKKTKQKGD